MIFAALDPTRSRKRVAFAGRPGDGPPSASRGLAGLFTLKSRPPKRSTTPAVSVISHEVSDTIGQKAFRGGALQQAPTAGNSFTSRASASFSSAGNAIFSKSKDDNRRKSTNSPGRKGPEPEFTGICPLDVVSEGQPGKAEKSPMRASLTSNTPRSGRKRLTVSGRRYTMVQDKFGIDEIESTEVFSRVSLTHEGTQEIFCVRFSPDHDYVAAAFGDGSISVCSSGNGEQITRIHVDGSPQLRHPTTMMRWRPCQQGEDFSNRIIAVTSNGCIAHYHALSRKKYFEINETESKRQLLCVDYRPDGSEFAVAGKPPEVRIFDEATQQQVQALQGGDVVHTLGHSNRIFSLKYLPSSPKVIVTGSWDKKVQFWDLRRGIAVRQILGPYICGDAVDISSNEEMILTGSSRKSNQLQLWDFGTGKLMQSIPWKSPQPCSVLVAQFSKHDFSGQIVAGGSGTNEVKLFDAQNGWESDRHIDAGAACYALDFSDDGSMLAVASADGCVRVIDFKRGH